MVVLGATLDDSVKSCNDNGHLDAGEIGRLTIEVMYTGAAPAAGVTAVVTTSTAGASFPQGPKAVFGELSPFTTASASVEVALADTVTTKENLALTVTVDSAFTCPSTAPFQTAPLVNYTEIPMASITNDVEAPDTTWTADGTVASQVWSRVELTPGNHVWSGIDFPATSDTALTSPPLMVSPTGSLVMQFDHRYAFQSSGGVNWDGAVIEISSDGGDTWNDINTLGDPGYNGTIGDPTMTMQNALMGHMGYVGQSPSWPDLATTTIDLGDTLAGKTVVVRFRIATDQIVGDSGWDLDQHSPSSGLADAPFPALVTGPPACAHPLPLPGPMRGAADRGRWTCRRRSAGSSSPAAAAAASSAATRRRRRSRLRRRRSRRCWGSGGAGRAVIKAESGGSDPAPRAASRRVTI